MKDYKPEVNKRCTHTKGRTLAFQSFLLLKLPLTSGLTVTLSREPKAWPSFQLVHNRCRFPEEQHGIGLNITAHFSPPNHPPPNVTQDIGETQFPSGAAIGCQGISMGELLDAVFGDRDLWYLRARYLVHFFSIDFLGSGKHARWRNVPCVLNNEKFCLPAPKHCESGPVQGVP